MISKSRIGVTTPSSVANILSSPMVSNIRKKRIAHIGGTENWFIASVKAINVKPVPDADWNINK